MKKISSRVNVSKKTSDQVLYMKEVSHLSNHQIAKKTGLAYSTVSQIKACGRPY